MDRTGFCVTIWNMAKGVKFVGLVKTLAVFLFVVGAFSIGISAFWMSTLKIPDFDAFDRRKVVQSTKIYDRTGEILLWDIHEDIARTVVPGEKISRNIKNATVAIEDSNFYNHKGIEPLSIVRASFVNLLSGRLEQGGSTISQQLIKNTYLTKEKTISRKIKEIILAIKLERMLPKEKILELYLNEISYGGNSYGVEAASQNFFNKSADSLTLAEAAYLAALPQAPTYFSPYGNHRDELESRKNLILGRMEGLGFITREEGEGAKQEHVVFLAKGNQGVKAPHFGTYVRTYLEEKYGKDLIEGGGLKVTTTLDYDLQIKAEELLKKEVENKSKTFHATNAGLVAIDPRTGQILAMVGSKDFFNVKDEGNFNITLAKRQPGSSIKPFVYATAFKKGFTPNTVVFDLKTEFNASCNPDGSSGRDNCYSPQNYDEKFRGPVTLREALAQSINIPAVKVLYLSGIKESLRTMRDLGITTLTDPNRYGLTLVLGGGEVTLLELTGGYSVFANNGIRNPETSILRIETSSGEVLEEFRPNPQNAIDKNIALLISSILSDNSARAPAFGERSYLYFPDREVAVKTGTTDNYRDAWVVGYTPSIAAGVWFGNNDNSPMEKKVAGFIAAPLWNAFMAEAFHTLPKESFEKSSPQPEPKPVFRGEWRGGETYKIDSISGKRATEFTPPELVVEKAITNVHSILYWVDKNNPLGDAPRDSTSDPQFNSWEWSVRNWAQAQGIREESVSEIPQDFDDVHKPEFIPVIKVLSPIGNDEHDLDSLLNIKISLESKFSLEQVDYFLNDNYLGSSKKSPFSFSFTPRGVANLNNSSVIKLVAYDKVRNKSEVVFPIFFKNVSL